MRSFFRVVAAFVRRDFRIAISYKFQFLFFTLSGLFVIMAFFFISRLVTVSAAEGPLASYDTDYFSFVLIGLAASGFLHSGLTGFTERLRTAMTEGSLEMMFSSPTPPVWILVFPCFWTFSFEGLRAAVMVVFGVWFFGAEIEMASLLACLVVVGLTLVAYSVFGMFAAGIIMIFKRGDPINWAFAHLSSLIAGAYFPVDLLPQALQHVAAFLPMTYAYRGIRMTVLAGAGIQEVLPDIAVLAGFSLLGIPIAAAVCNAAVARAKREGSLGTF